MINIYKPIGISPLDAIKLLQKRFPKYKNMPVTYVGRLDPMAEGVLILLTGDEVHRRDEYMKLDKEYETEMLLGFKTDTYDILGIPATAQQVEPLLEKELNDKVCALKGEISLPLPPYSSYKIKGKPLFMWAREGKLKEIEIPMRNTEIHNINLLGTYEIKASDLLMQITKKISLIKGDFRQEEILQRWQDILNKNIEQKYFVVKAKFNVSSGTYIRSIAHYFGDKLGTGAVLFGLTRTKVGDFDIVDSIKI